MQAKVGLQRDSISSIGNNLFGFVLGSAAAIIGVLAYGGDIAHDIGNGETLQTVARILPLPGIIVLVLYYLIDWYDLNLAVYIDEFVGRKQVCLYVISALVVAALPALALGGKTDIAALLAAVYFPLADYKRDRLLREGSRHLENRDDLLSFGQKQGIASVLRILLVVVSAITLIMAAWSLRTQTAGMMLAVAIALLLIWVIACILKMLRSVYFLQSEYVRCLTRLGIYSAKEVPTDCSQQSAIEYQCEGAIAAKQEGPVDEISDTTSVS